MQGIGLRSAAPPQLSKLQQTTTLSKAAKLRLAWMDYYQAHGNNAALTFGVYSCMQLKAVVCSLPIVAEASYSFGYFVSVGSDELADMKHSTAQKTHGSILDKQLVKYVQHTGKCLTALPYEGLVATDTESTVVVCLCPDVHTLQSALWCNEATKQEERNGFILMEDNWSSTLRVGKLTRQKRIYHGYQLCYMMGT